MHVLVSWRPLYLWRESACEFRRVERALPFLNHCSPIVHFYGHVCVSYANNLLKDRRAYDRPVYRKKEGIQASTVTDAPFRTIEEAVEHAKRAFALKKYEQSVDHYATALELAYVALTCYSIRNCLTRVCRTEKYGEDTLETADLYFSYGKALLENAISQASVLGTQGEEEQEEKVNTKGMSTLFDNPELFCPLMCAFRLQCRWQWSYSFFLGRCRGCRRLSGDG